jgi:hypothetical protein
LKVLVLVEVEELQVVVDILVVVVVHTQQVVVVEAHMNRYEVGNNEYGKNRCRLAFRLVPHEKLPNLLSLT